MLWSLIFGLAGFLIGWILAGRLLVTASARIASQIMFEQIGEWRDLLFAASTSEPRHKDEKIALLLQLINDTLGHTAS